MGTNLKLILILLLLFGCKSSKEYLNTREVDEKKDKVEYVVTDLTKVDKLFSDLVINTDKKLDFIVYDTNKSIEGKPPVLMKGTLTDKSILTDKSRREELITDNSKSLVEDKGQINIRDELKVKEKKNNKTWIEQLTRFGVVVILLLGAGLYIKKRWF